MKQKTALKLSAVFFDPAWSNAGVAGSHEVNAM